MALTYDGGFIYDKVTCHVSYLTVRSSVRLQVITTRFSGSQIDFLLNFQIYLLGSKHQELQVAEMAGSAQLQLPTSTAPDRNSAAEQPHGTLVSHALPNATCFPVT